MAQNRYFVSVPLYVILKVMPLTAHRGSLLKAGAAEDASRAAVHVEPSDTMCVRKAQCQAPPDNPETGDTYEVSRERKKLRWPESRAPKRIQAAQQQCEYVCIQARPISTNPGYGGSVRVCANAWDVLRCTPSRGGRGRRAAVHFVLCFECGGISFFFRFSLLRTHTACCKYEAPLPHLPF